MSKKQLYGDRDFDQLDHVQSKNFCAQVVDKCSDYKINMITASYLDEKIKSLEKKFKKNNCFLFMEIGLDPGIDHLSAKKDIDNLNKKGEILGFESYTGGLIKTPEQKQAEQQQMMQQQSMDKLEDTISGMAQKGALPITEKAMEQVQQQTDQGVE